MVRRLSEKQRRFVEAYLGRAKGNGRMAAQLAGYQGNHRTLASTANRLLSTNRVRDALRDRRSKLGLPTKHEIQHFLANVMRNDDIDPKRRFQAAEILAKSLNAFQHKRRKEPRAELIILPNPNLTQKSGSR